MKIGMIQAVRGAEVITDKMIVEDIKNQISNIVNKPVEGYEVVVINSQFPDQKIKIGREMPEWERAKIIQFSKDHATNFAWTTSDMLGINPQVTVHELNIDPTFPPIRQKARVFGEKKNEGIKQEVMKLLEAKVIREVAYLTWLANVVMVKKSNGKCRMCVNFTDLNKACPKDF